MSGLPLRSSVHYIGSYEPSYARHRILQGGLRQLGYEVIDHSDRTFLPLRWVRLFRVVQSIPRTGVLVMGEASNYLTPVLYAARLLGHPAVFDSFVSLRDTIHDRIDSACRYPVGFFGKIIDRLNGGAAHITIVDTEQTALYFASKIGLRPQQLRVVYVGAETDVFRPAPVKAVLNRPPLVLFYGTFIPLHGLDVILRAALELQRRKAGVTIQLVGDGQHYQRALALSERLGLDNVVFGPRRVSYFSLPDLIASADICLGIFADRPKTRRVIPHKVYQAAACARPVITADTPAIREVFDDRSAVLVEPGSPTALAEAIMELAGDPSRRAALGGASSDLVHGRYAPVRLAADLAATFPKLGF